MAWFLTLTLLLQTVVLIKLGTIRRKIEHVDRGLTIIYALEMHQLSHICPDSYQNLKVGMEAEAIMRESGLEH